MSRDRDLEIRLRMAAMAPASSYVSVQREELLADLFELLELRGCQTSHPETASGALRRHPSATGRAGAAPSSADEEGRRGRTGMPGTGSPVRETRRRWR